MQTKSGDFASMYVVLVNGCPPASKHKLPLPTLSKPGEWFEKPTELELTDQPAALWSDNSKVFLVEVGENEDQLRLVRVLSITQLESLNIFQKGSFSLTSGVAAVGGSANLEVSGDAIVYASGDSVTIARGTTRVFASGRASGRCYGKVTLRASGHSKFALFEDTTAQAIDKARITGRGYAKVDASGETHVDLYDFCQGNAEGSAVVRGYNRSFISASDLTKVKTFDQAKAFVRGKANATADGSSQIFAAPGVSVRPLNFAGVAQLQEWPDLARAAR